MSIPAYTLDEVKTMVSVPGGTFLQLGGGEGRLHTITGFKIGKYEITYELWYTVYQWAIANGYQFSNAGCEGHDGTAGAAPTTAKHEPVTTINWRDVIVWCNAYSQMGGKIPVYYSDSGFTTPIKDSRDGSYGSSVNMTAGSFDYPYVNWNATGYRLPTEGEWQYAARYKDGMEWTPDLWASGATGDYTDDIATGLVAWYGKNSANSTKAVGTKAANGLGIHDMSGNIHEWCWDWWGHLDWTGTKQDYRGPSSSTWRMALGGGFSAPATLLYINRTYYSIPYAEYNWSGFRVAQKQ